MRPIIKIQTRADMDYSGEKRLLVSTLEWYGVIALASSLQNVNYELTESNGKPKRIESSKEEHTSAMILQHEF